MMLYRSVEVLEVPHTHEAAEKLADAARADMERGYATAAEVFEKYGYTLADDHEEIVATELAKVTADRTYGRLGKFPGQYFTARIGDEDVAYTRLNRFGALDLAPYKTGVTKKALELFGSINVIGTLSPLFGIHGLYPSVSEHSTVDKERGYNALVGKAIDLSNGRPIYMNVQEDDLVTDVLLENDFEPTGELTQGVVHALELPQQLYVRKNHKTT